MIYLRTTSIIALVLALVLAVACAAPAEPTPVPAAPTTKPAAVPTSAAQPSPSAPSAPQVTPTRVPTAVPSPAATPITAPKPAVAVPASGVSAADLAAKAKSATEYSFELAVGVAGQTAKGKAYVKGTKMRQEISLMGLEMVVLVDVSAKVAFTLNPEQNVAMKMDFSQLPGQGEIPSDRVTALPPNAEMIGTETLDGKTAAVYRVPDAQSDYKIWIWTERGVPLKIEVGSGNGKLVMEFSNYHFGSQPDSLFEIPPGVEIGDLTIGGSGVTGGASAPGR